MLIGFHSIRDICGMESQIFTPFHRQWCIKQTKMISTSPFALFFREHPKESVGDWEHYLSCVKNPMWLHEVNDRLRSNSYAYVEEWVSDMMSVFDNALSYNAPETAGWDCAHILKKMFIKNCIPVPSSDIAMKNIKRTALLKKLKAKLNEPPAGVNALFWDVEKIRAAGDELRPLKLSKKQDLKISSEWKAMFAASKKSQEPATSNE